MTSMMDCLSSIVSPPLNVGGILSYCLPIWTITCEKGDIGLLFSSSNEKGSYRGLWSIDYIMSVECNGIYALLEASHLIDDFGWHMLYVLVCVRPRLDVELGW